jgi:hypothetical protein
LAKAQLFALRLNFGLDQLGAAHVARSNRIANSFPVIEATATADSFGFSYGSASVAARIRTGSGTRWSR